MQLGYCRQPDTGLGLRGTQPMLGSMGRMCARGPAAALCQHRWDSCNEWAKEPPQRHTVPNSKHMALLWTAEEPQQQQQRRQH